MLRNSSYDDLQSTTHCAVHVSIHNVVYRSMYIPVLCTCMAHDNSRLHQTRRGEGGGGGIIIIIFTMLSDGDL